MDSGSLMVLLMDLRIGSTSSVVRPYIPCTSSKTLVHRPPTKGFSSVDFMFILEIMLLNSGWIVLSISTPKNSVDNLNKFACSFNMHCQLNGGNFQLLQKVFKSSIDMLHRACKSVSSIKVISNFKIFEPFSSEIIHS